MCVCVCVCVYTKIADSQIFRQEYCLCRIGGIASDSRNCIYHIKKAVCHSSYNIYTLTINPSPPSGCNLKLCKDTTKKAHGQPTSMIFFVRKQNGGERRGRRNKIASPRGPNCEGSQFLTRGPAIYDSGLRKAERVRLPKRKRTLS